MALDPSIYQTLRPIEMPSMLDSASKAMSLSQLSMQNKRLQQSDADDQALRDTLIKNTSADGTTDYKTALSQLGKIAPAKAMELQTHLAGVNKATREDQDAQMVAHLKRADILGNALQSIAGLNPQARAQAYPGLIAQLKQQGVIEPTQQIPDQYDDQYYGAMMGRYHQSKDYIEAELKRAETAKNLAEAGKAKSEKSGKPPAAEQIDKLAGHQAAMGLIGDLRQAIGANKGDMGPISGRWSAANPYDKRGQDFSALIKKAAQVIGKSLEGGKLTDQDYAKYTKMLPNQSDLPDVAVAKLDQLERLVGTQNNSDLDAFGKAGLNVSKFSQVPLKEIGITKPERGKSRREGVAQAAERPDFNSMTDEQLKAYVGGK